MDKDKNKYIELCNSLRELSDDTNKGVASLIVKDDNIISYGVNQLPKGVNKSKDRCEKPLKDYWMLHSERNAIFKAAKIGISLEGSEMYCTYYPCSDCARAIVQSGIVKIYAPEPKITHHKWGETWKISMDIFRESGVYVEYYKK